jgi:hypothetical protein
MTENTAESPREVDAPGVASRAIVATAEQLAAALPPPPSPIATYRLQLNPIFTFRDASRVVPYLADLGIGALYASP